MPMHKVPIQSAVAFVPKAEAEPVPANVEVTVVRDGGISLAGRIYHLGAVVTAPRDAVRDALARGLVVEEFEVPEDAEA